MHLNGDFNLAGAVNQQDYLLVDTPLARKQGGTLSPDLRATRESQFGLDYVSELLTAIPEPPSLSAILFPLSSLLLPRRRR